MRKLALLGTLYFTQGLPYGFFTQALPVLMRKEGWSLGAIGLTSLLALPWALKFLWAPLVDRWFWPHIGRRRSWILPLQVLTVLFLAAIAMVPAGSAIPVLIASVFVVNLLAATQDIATDGLAVELLPPSERGIANGIQVAGYRLGMIVGGGALLIAYDDVGWAGTFGAMAVLVALMTIPIALTREEPVPIESAPRPLVHFLRRPGAIPILILTASWKFGESFAMGMLRPYLADLGLGLADVGRLLGTVGFVSGLVGALLGGALIGRVGRQRSLIAFGLLQCAAVGLYALLAAQILSRDHLTLIIAAEHVASGMATAALFTCMMDWCDVRASGADYTVQASAVVIAQGSAAALSGYSATALGYPTHFALGAVLAALALVPAAVLFPKPLVHISKSAAETGADKTA